MTRRGFTVVEVLMVVTMIGFVAVLALPLLSSGVSARDESSSAANGADVLREAQSDVMSGKNNARYGVHFEATKFVLFQGAAYSAADPNNGVHQLTGRVTMTAVSLAPGGACTLPAGTGNCDIHFADHRGVPTETGTVTFTSDTGRIGVISINAAGMVDVN